MGVCNFCTVCTYNAYKNHKHDLNYPDFSKHDFICSICLELVFQPMITNDWRYRVICKSCIPMLPCSLTVLPNYPLRNQLNVFLKKAGLKTTYVNY